MGERGGEGLCHGIARMCAALRAHQRRWHRREALPPHTPTRALATYRLVGEQKELQLWLLRECTQQSRQCEVALESVLEHLLQSVEQLRQQHAAAEELAFLSDVGIAA